MATQDIPFGAGEQFGFAEVLQVIALRGRTGTLLLTGHDSQAFLEFDAGQIVSGDLLPPIGTNDIAGLPVDAQRLAVSADIQRVLTDVLEWPAGRASFATNDRVSPTHHAFDVDMLLIEAVRLLDERSDAAATLPSPSDVLIWAESPPPVTAATLLSDVQRQVLAHCNGRTTLSDIARRLHTSDLTIGHAAAELLARRYVQRSAESLSASMDVEVEAALSWRAVDIQVRTAAIAGLRHHGKQVQALVAVGVSAVDALISVLCKPAPAPARAWIASTLDALQRQYPALELISLRADGLESGDLAGAHDFLSGVEGDRFYIEVLDGLYDFLLQLAVYLVDEHVGDRSTSDRIRGTLAALLLEIETALHQVKPPATLAASAGLSDLRRKHFHLVA